MEIYTYMQTVFVEKLVVTKLVSILPLDPNLNHFNDTLFLQNPLNSIFSFTPRSPKLSFSLQVWQPTFCTHFISTMCVMSCTCHAWFESFITLWISTNYEAAHYVFFSNILSRPSSYVCSRTPPIAYYVLPLALDTKFLPSSLPWFLLSLFIFLLLTFWDCCTEPYRRAEGIKFLLVHYMYSSNKFLSM
jgi:hypothetical protein